MPKFKMINEDGSISNYEITPPAPVAIPPKVYNEGKPIKVYPPKRPKPVQPKPVKEEPRVEEPIRVEESIAPKAVPKSVVKPPKPPKPPKPIKEETPHYSPSLIEEDDPIVESPKPEPVKEAPAVKPEPVQPSGMVFQPIIKNKRAHQNEELIQSPSGKQYGIDSKTIDIIVDKIITSMSDKFVTKEEAKSVVEHTLQEMVIKNDLK